MISHFQAIVLGIIQGLTEFLPVSSSAHLTLAPWLFGWDDPGLAFDVFLHMGTLVALLVYYWREWLDMGLSLVRRDQQSRRRLGLIVVASIPGAIIGLLLEKQAETIFRSPVLIAGALALLGLVLWGADMMAPQERKMDGLRVVDALVIGLSQALAIVPGVSRSGATITMGLVLGLERQDAANFSFLMATPIIAGAGLVEARKIIHSGIDANLLYGFIASLVFGLIAIAALIRYVRTRTYRPFALYRVVIAAIVVAIALARA